MAKSRVAAGRVFLIWLVLWLTAACSGHASPEVGEVDSGATRSSDAGAQVIGEVATRARMATAVYPSTSSWMARTAHFARDDIHSIQVGFPNWAGDPTNGEIGTGGPIVIIASIEYPPGTFTQLTFDGSITASIPDLTTLFSDATELRKDIPRSAKFFVRFDELPSVAIPYTLSGMKNVALGDALNFGGSDQTMSGTVLDNTQSLLSPCAILGLTANKTLSLAGDSRVAGLNDAADSVTGDVGELARPFGPDYAYIQMGEPSESAAVFLANHERRLELARYTTTVISNYGINDAYQGADAATIEARLTAEQQLLSGWEFYPVTVAPLSAGAWTAADGSDQTITPSNVARVGVNDWMRAAGTPFFELADVVESARNSGKWKSDGTVDKYTTDGDHETPFAARLFAFSLN